VLPMVRGAAEAAPPRYDVSRADHGQPHPEPSLAKLMARLLLLNPVINFIMRGGFTALSVTLLASLVTVQPVPIPSGVQPKDAPGVVPVDAARHCVVQADRIEGTDGIRRVLEWPVGREHHTLRAHHRQT
jgi:hypothetical protein